MTVLLVDDNQDTIFLMDVLFRKSGVVSQHFLETSGSDALDFLEETSVIPDCIFVDIKMPEMGGFEFVEEYEKRFAIQAPHTRVFFLSSSARQSDREQATSYKCAKGFILKPLTMGKLREIQESLVYN